MDKTININLGGVLFHIDKEAYTILRDYLLALSNKLRNIPGWNETIEDIELRIAEIFLSKRSATDIINRKDVEDMILIIGKPEDFSQAEDTGDERKPGSGYGRRMMRQKHGRIINVTSVVGVIGNPGQCNYSAAKAGLLGLTRSLARELVSRNITVNAVAPGFIETDMTLRLPEKVRVELLTQIPAGRYGTPEDVAAAVKFLASDAAGYITGQIIHVNGGMFMG